jgi:hypothetical protein
MDGVAWCHYARGTGGLSDAPSAGSRLALEGSRGPRRKPGASSYMLTRLSLHRKGNVLRRVFVPFALVRAAVTRHAARGAREAVAQGLILVHFSAQLKRFVWDRGCVEGLLRGSLGGVRGS